MRFVITGFGPFGRVAENPSEVTAEIACKRLREAGINCEAVHLKASIRSVDSFYEGVNDPSELFVIHIGVDASSKGLVIERYGRNILDFPIPDAESAQPRESRIDETLKYDEKVENTLNVPEIVDQLGGGFGVSEDAGTYVCNYCYFKALQFVGKKTKGAFFVHVPLFQCVGSEEQGALVARLVEHINKHFSQ